jgi:hypothetical protein
VIRRLCRALARGATLPTEGARLTTREAFAFIGGVDSERHALQLLHRWAAWRWHTAALTLAPGVWWWRTTSDHYVYVAGWWRGRIELRLISGMTMNQARQLYRVPVRDAMPQDLVDDLAARAPAVLVDRKELRSWR